MAQNAIEASAHQKQRTQLLLSSTKAAQQIASSSTPYGSCSEHIEEHSPIGGAEGADFDDAIGYLGRTTTSHHNDCNKEGQEKSELPNDSNKEGQEKNSTPSPLGKKEKQTNPLEARPDIVSDVIQYCSLYEFIFVAVVNSTWNTAWRGCSRSNYTSVHQALTTPARTEQVLNMDDPDFERTADKVGGVFALVARAGNLDGLKLSTRRYGRCWILERSTRLLTVFAARNGHIHILEWARDRGCPWGVDTFRSAARSGNITVMQWLLDHNCSWDASTCASAAMGGYLEALQWAKEHECPWDENTCKNAALKGYLDLLQWAREKQCPWDEKTCENAALGGHLDVLQWAHSQGCPWSEKVCSNAALGGHLEVLMWARAQGCPWNEATCSAAAKCGHLDVLKWARANKCPWDASTLEQAFRRGHIEVYNWAVEHGCQGWSPRSQTRSRYYSETL